MEISIRNINRFSYSASIGFHLILFLILWLVNVSFEYQPKDYVELSFGTTGGEGSSGTEGVAFDERLEKAELQEKESTKEKSPEVKEVELPKAKNTDVADVNPAKKDKEVKKETSSQTEERESNNPPGDKKGNLNQGTGDFGFHFEGGGLGTRKIYSYVIPTYPEGVNKEIDIRLRFTIKPDGTVGSIFLLTKADTRLENAAINSLWQWRFEPLTMNQSQTDQTAIIVFPYRLQ
ncbi:MAG: energy transducer TonB [Ignavibacteriaceae bacterium]|jgi:protein TonB|nr:energy transducer TonB [Ignavibacteriaceae bacterium]